MSDLGGSLVGLLMKSPNFNLIATMELNEAFYFVEEIVKEHKDTRDYNRYCLENLLMAFNGKPISYKDYLNKVYKKVNKPIATTKSIEDNNNRTQTILDKFKSNGIKRVI
ncbi:MAG: hypothetical protein ACRDD7_01310 [Peptostreptococcaceae bacterium]